MKKHNSLIMVVSLVIAGAIGFSPASSAFAASAEEIENPPVLVIEANAKEVSPMEISEEVEVIEEVETVEVSETTECPEVPEVTECPEVPEDVEEVDVVSEPEAIIITTDVSAYIDYIDYDAETFSVDELFFGVWDHDADANAKVVQYGDEYYFVVEWNMCEGAGFVHLGRENYEGEEFFICGGDEFRTMIIRSFFEAERMFEV